MLPPQAGQKTLALRSIRPSAFTCAFIALAAAVMPGPAVAQDERPILKIDRFAPDQLEIDAGENASVVLHGRSLDELTEAHAILNGEDAEGIVATLAATDSGNTTSRVLRLTSTLDASPGRYRIRLRAGRGIVATNARMELTVVEPDLTPSIVDVAVDEPALENTPLRLRVRTACPAGLAHVRAKSGTVVVEAVPQSGDTNVVAFELPISDPGLHEIELVAVDIAGRNSEPISRDVDVRAVAADLQIIDIGLRPEAAYAGQSTGAFVTVANHGSTAATFAAGEALLSWTVDGVEQQEFTISRETHLAPAQEQVFGPLIFEVDQAGDHSVGATVDPKALVRESDDSNNTQVRSFAIGPRRYPDLTITSVEFDPPVPSAGRPFRAQVRVMNQGSGTATIFPPDRILTADGFQELRAGPQAMILGPSQLMQLEVMVLPEQTTIGPKRWVFGIDPDDRVVESAEDNNSYVAGLTLGATGTALPDLVLDTATPRPAEPTAGGSVFLVLGIKNIGTVEAVVPAGHRLYEIGGPMGTVVPILTQAAERIGPGKTLGMRTVDFSFESTGTHQLSIVLDPEAIVTETDESNNVSQFTIEVK